MFAGKFIYSVLCHLLLRQGPANKTHAALDKSPHFTSLEATCLLISMTFFFVSRGTLWPLPIEVVPPSRNPETCGMIFADFKG